MDGNKLKIDSIIARAFKKVLNMHGYGFQYSVLKKAEELFNERKSPWAIPIPEFPVEIQGYGTRIDFILRHKSRPIFMIAECKRTNPALSNWCFAKASYITDVQLASCVFIEAIKIDKSGLAQVTTDILSSSKNIYHVALEVKSNKEGDIGGSGRGAIEEAATQICRGLNGMIDFLSKHVNIFYKDNVAGILPVIFTTARLWTSNVDLGSVDIEHGKFDISSLEVQEKSWLFYHYTQSPGLKHSHHSVSASTDLSDTLYNEYVRTIAIVSASGINDFMSSEVLR